MCTLFGANFHKTSEAKTLHLDPIGFNCINKKTFIVLLCSTEGHTDLDACHDGEYILFGVNYPFKDIFYAITPS